MEKKEILELIEIFNQKGLTELSIENEGFSLTLKKEPAPMRVEAPIYQSVGTPQVESIPPAQAPASPVAAPTKPLSEGAVTAPLVGVFYESSAPGEAPFVKIGDTVEKGQTLCLIEAMKMMNELKAQEKGIIRDIKVENGQMVEFGQVIFEVEKC